MLGLTGCRKHKVEPQAETRTASVVAPELEANGLARYPGATYQNQAASPIHWQPWLPETLERAKAANRLIFAVITLPQQPGLQTAMASLVENPKLVSEINDNYVPVLIDGDAAREMGLLTADLCSEIRRPLQLPLFVWMTAAAHPVAWLPMNPGSGESVVELFNQSHAAVSQTWRDDSAYVLKNSSLDAANRRERITQRRTSRVASEQPKEDTLKAIRKLNSLYDPLSRSFDEAGGLFPAGSLDLLATAAIQPGVPEDIRTRSLTTTRELLKDLLASAMFDPLDGGVFTARRGMSWALPSFTRDCVTQARVAVALLNAYRATGDRRALEKASGLISFAEKSFQTSEGLFSVGMVGKTNTADWLWSIEDIEQALPAEDAAWWIQATGMKRLGNLPSEVDPRREYFRGNSLALSKDLAGIAADLNVPPDEFATRFHTACKILLKARDTRLGPVTRDDTSHAGASFRMVSAYAAAFAATGEEGFRKKAVELLDKARAAFSDGPGLREFSREAPASLGAGRAFIYGLALQAALDVSAITSDERWLTWSEDLATTAAERFTGDGFLRECPANAQIMDLPISDALMLFDDSTAGLVSFAECRLANRGRPLLRSFSELATPLPTTSVDRPILHTDLLQATLAREFPVTLVTGTDLPADLRQAVERMSPRMIQRRAAKSGDEIPAASVTVRVPDGEALTVSNPADLGKAISPVTP